MCGFVPGDRIAGRGTVSCEFQSTNLFRVWCASDLCPLPSRRSESSDLRDSGLWIWIQSLHFFDGFRTRGLDLRTLGFG